MTRHAAWTLGVGVGVALIVTAMVTDTGPAFPAVILGLIVEAGAFGVAVVLRMNTKRGEVDRPWVRLLFILSFFLATMAFRNDSASRALSFGFAALGGLIAGMAWNSPKLRGDDSWDI